MTGGDAGVLAIGSIAAALDLRELGTGSSTPHSKLHQFRQRFSLRG